MSLSKSQVTKWKLDFISPNLAEVSGGREKAGLEEKLKRRKEGGRAAIAFAKSAVIKFLTNAASLVRRFSVQIVKLT